MGILDQVTSMRQEGKEESEIIRSLQEQGISPKEIQDTLSQSQIKQAISEQPPTPETQSNYPTTQEYTPQPEYSPETYAPSPQSYSEPQYAEQSYQPQTYDETSYASTGTESMMEIAEQVASEKVKEIKIQIEKIMEFATLTNTKIESLQERIKRIEATMDKLQLSVLDKVGSYGKDLSSIKNEMEMIENNFSKIIAKK